MRCFCLGKRDGGGEARGFETIMHAMQFFRGHAKLDVFLPRVFGVADAAEKTAMAEHPVQPILQRGDLVGPGAVMVEYHALAEQQGHPGDPEIAGVDEVGLAERGAARW